MASIDRYRGNIPDLYDLTNFDKNKTHSLKFIFSIKSLFNNNKSFMKLIYVDDILIDKKYDKNTRFCSYDIIKLLKNITHISKLYKIITDDFKWFDIYILTNEKQSVNKRLITDMRTLTIANKFYIENLDLSYLDLNVALNKDIDKTNDDNIFITIYIRETLKRNINNSPIYYHSIYDYDNEISLFSFGKTSEIYDCYYGIGLMINFIHKITTFNKKLKSYTLPISNMKNVSITLDLYCFHDEALIYYFNKLINHNTNEIISLLPEIKCTNNSCDNITNIKTYETYKKERLCSCILKKIKNNILECYKENIKKNKLEFIIKYDDINKITDNITSMKCISLMKKFIY